MKLAENLRSGQLQAERLRNRKTGRAGTILPKAMPAPRRDTRPVQVLMPDGFQKRRSGLIVPSGAAA
jgi:hypothetical protein